MILGGWLLLENNIGAAKRSRASDVVPDPKSLLEHEDFDMAFPRSRSGLYFSFELWQQNFIQNE
jgi:hypothetical protein